MINDLEPGAKPPSPLRSMVRLMARGIQARGRPAPPDSAAPRRKVALERSAIAIDPRRVLAYAHATGGEGIEGFGSARPAAPPFFSATWETALALEMFAGMERPLPLGAFVHLSTDLVCARPLVAGDVVRCRVELERLEPVRRGLRLTVLARNWLGAGQLCSQSTSIFQVRTAAQGLPADAPRPPAPEPEAPADGWVELVRWDLPGGAGRRYARVSGDYNPIHLWAATARPFGFRSPILHGYATAARAAHTLIEHCLHGDPAEFRGMRIAFRAPLPLPASVCFLVNDDGPRRWFRVAAPGEGPVYAEGSWGARPD
ncbi:MAG TPA: MaoC/PaaZ C-terminal domain-containing protein [Longimicrobium sp.]|jgi:acyl dehydratase|uniref:MaoC/PaaZ C-terminal domain-containing protein n=1 Tax=Longimicrobium sp. TaxID=2029185 RepID=UPI002EDBB236